MTGRIRAAICDFDGTLADSMYVWDEAPRALIRSHGGTPPADLAQTIAPLTIDEALGWMRDRFMPGADTCALKRELYAVIRREYEQAVQPKPGAPEAVRRMRAQGMRLCVLSATDSSMISAALRRFGILDEFEFVAFSDDWGGKTRPECFLAAAARLGARPEETVVFEDALHAARTARGVGFNVAGVYDASSAADWPELERLADWSGQLIGDWPGPAEMRGR